MNEQLAAIKARRDAITPGNYFYRGQCIYSGMVLVCVIPIRDNADAAFIAAAPADIDTLLAECERLTGELATVRAQADAAWQREHTERVRLEERLKAAEQRAQALELELDCID